jgi:flavin reductase (DIM6/NTAB) family NADH-FMN oxidoreductase RutF
MVDDKLITLELDEPIWERVFVVAPLVLIGTKEGQGFDLAPKHMVAPMGWDNYFGFVCAPAHRTYHNAKAAGCFTVSYPRPAQVAMTSLAASPRQAGPGPDKPILEVLPTRPATKVEGVLLEGAYLMLECELHEVVDGLGENSLLIGRIVAAHADEDAIRVHDRDDQDLIYNSPLLAYVSPGRYARIEDTMVFPFPADFSR